MPDRIAVLKFVFSALTSCFPTSNDRARKYPVSSVVTTRVNPVSTLLTVTMAPAINAPSESSTRPVIVAVVWATAEVILSVKKIVVTKTKNHHFTLPLLRSKQPDKCRPEPINISSRVNQQLTGFGFNCERE